MEKQLQNGYILINCINVQSVGTFCEKLLFLDKEPPGPAGGLEAYVAHRKRRKQIFVRKKGLGNCSPALLKIVPMDKCKGWSNHFCWCAGTGPPFTKEGSAASFRRPARGRHRPPRGYRSVRLRPGASRPHSRRTPPSQGRPNRRQ